VSEGSAGRTWPAASKATRKLGRLRAHWLLTKRSTSAARTTYGLGLAFASVGLSSRRSAGGCAALRTAARCRGRRRGSGCEAIMATGEAIGGNDGGEKPTTSTQHEAASIHEPATREASVSDLACAFSPEKKRAVALAVREKFARLAAPTDGGRGRGEHREITVSCHGWKERTHSPPCAFARFAPR